MKHIFKSNNTNLFILLLLISNIIIFFILKIPSKHYEIFLNLSSITNLFLENSHDFNELKSNSNWHSLLILFTLFKIPNFIFGISENILFKIYILFLLNIYVFSSYILLKKISFEFNIKLSSADIFFIFSFIGLNNYLLYSLNDVETALIFTWPLFCLLTINFLKNKIKSSYLYLIFYLCIFTPPNMAYGLQYLAFFILTLIIFDKNLFNKRNLICFISLFFVLIIFYYQNIILIFNQSTAIDIFREDFFTNSRFNNYLNIINFISNSDLNELGDNFSLFVSGRKNFFSFAIVLLNGLLIFYIIIKEKNNKFLKYLILITIIFISSTNFTNLFYPLFKYFFNESLLFLTFRNTFKLSSLLIFLLFVLIVTNFNKYDHLKIFIKLFAIIKLIIIFIYYPSYIKDNKQIFITKIPSHQKKFADFVNKKITPGKIFLKQPSQYHYYYDWGSYTIGMIPYSNSHVIKNGASFVKYKLPLYLLDYKSATFSSRIPPSKLNKIENLFCNYIDILNIDFIYLLKDVDYKIYNLSNFGNHKYFFDQLSCLEIYRSFENKVYLYKFEKNSNKNYKFFINEKKKNLFLFKDTFNSFENLIEIFKESSPKNIFYDNEYNQSNYNIILVPEEEILQIKKINSLLSYSDFKKGSKYILNKEDNRKKIIFKIGKKNLEIFRNYKVFKANYVFDLYMFEHYEYNGKLYLLDYKNFISLLLFFLLLTINIFLIFINLKKVKDD